MCSSRFRKFLSTSIFDFSVITNPNRVIFDSTDRFLSLLSKNTIFPNFSPQFIVQFDQILKDISKISKFPVDSTRIYHYTLNSLLIPQIGKFGIIFDTRPCEIDDLAVSSRQVPFRDSYRSIHWTLSPKSTYYLSLVSLHRWLHDQSYLLYKSDKIVLFFLLIRCPSRISHE